jgi:hypothetical protein
MIPDLKNEEWRCIENTNGNYFVSSLGRVKSVDRYVFNPILKDKVQFRIGQLLTPINAGNGYFRVRIVYSDGVRLTNVHRLVAVAFIPNPENKPQVNHKNGHPNDNRLDNLEWMTASENNLHCYREFGRKENRRLPDLKNRQQLKDVYDSYIKAEKTVQERIIEPDLEGEKWKFIDNTSGVYMISNMGRVKSLDMMVSNQNGVYYRNGRILACGADKSGYLHVSIKYTNYGRKTEKVHRLVAFYFVNGYIEGKWVNHYNGNKWDNVSTNLQWVTPSENSIHSFRVLGRINGQKGKKGVLNVQSKKVRCTTLGIDFECLNMAASALGTDGFTISKICKGIKTQIHGLHFKFI